MSRDATPQDVIEGRARWCVVCADNRDALPTLPKVDAVVTDPPYGIGFDYDGRYSDTRENLRELVRESIAPTIERIGRVFVFCGPSQIHEYPEPSWTCSVVWDTTGSFGPFGYSQWMPVLCYGKDVPGFGSVSSGVLKGDVFRLTGGAGVGFMREAVDHPCPKPTSVMVWAVGRFTLQDSVVLDPFCGSGTTGVACLRLGRRFIGIEKDAHYAEVTRERLEAESRGLTLRDARAGQLSLLGENP